MTSAYNFLFVIPSLFVAADPAADKQVELRSFEPSFNIEVTGIVLTNTPVQKIVITALDADGNLDKSYNGRPLIQGIKLVVKDLKTGKERDTELDRFTNGMLTLKTNLAQGMKVYIVEREIIVNPKGVRQGSLQVYRVLRWFSLVPPLLAIVLAVWMRNAILALFVGVWSGAVIFDRGDFFLGFVHTLDTHLLGVLVRDNRGEYSHMLIILFTLFLGAMVGVMANSGGTSALVESLSKYACNRKQGQVMTWLMGLVIFFDDYANTLLVGSTMRPLTDRLKISREKLAFIVDSTAAPVAGLALISTWVGVEVGFIEDSYAQIFGGRGIEWNSYSTFLSTLFYRFYPLHMLVFVLLISYSGNDFGPMLKAEVRAIAYNQVSRPGSLATEFHDDLAASRSSRQLLRNALVPLFVLIFVVVMGLWWTGSQNLSQLNFEREQQGLLPIQFTLWNMLSHANSNRVLFLSSFAASVTAVAIAVITRSLTLSDSMDAWAEGAKSMFFPVVILVLAWGVAAMCDTNHLNTSGFLVELTQNRLSVTWMPALAFLLSAAVAFATGTSWATMGLLMPLFISVTYSLLLGINEGDDPNHHLLLATIGAILGGAIFGDHCSPISDTTVLSSAASGCDHIDHVTTQLPYAGSVALVALFMGYIPIGFGFWQPMVLMPLGLIVIYLLTHFLGRPVEEYAKNLSDKPTDLPDMSALIPDDDDEGFSDLNPTTEESSAE
jgi:Na+/H+ antiporter NhaC